VRGLRRVRASGDQGSALAIALTFLMVFGVLIGVVLQFASTGQRTTLSVREEATNTYAGGGALDGAINTVRSALTSGVAPSGATTCFSLAAGVLGNPTSVSVSCEPRPTSGAPLGGSTASQPGAAVTALSSTAAEGVSVTSGTTTLQGGAAVNRALTVAGGATLDSTGYPVEAGTCPPMPGSGTVKDSCTLGSGVTDPAYPGPDTSVAVQQATLPACAATVTLQPGIYRSASALQAVLNCNGAIIVLAGGTYFFDFQDVGTHELVFNGAAPRNSVIVGGARSGTSCVPGSPGVDLAFGGDSRLNIASGRVDLCALVPIGDTTQQHIVLRGLKTTTPVATTSTTAGASATNVLPLGTAWSDPTNNGAFVNTPAVTTTTRIGNGKPDAVLRVALPSSVVPLDAQNITATITVRESVSTGNAATTTTAALRDPAGATVATRALTTCSPVANCSGVLRDDTTTAITGLTVAQLNGSPTPATIDVRLSKSGGGNADGVIDGVIVNLSYDLPVRATCQLASPAGSCMAGSVPTAPLLTATGAYGTTPLALHGTVYAPTSSVDLRLTSVNATVVDRGVVVRHLVLSMTPAAGAPALISVPDIGRQPRRVIMIATDSAGAQLARADVTFASADGTRNGDLPTVLEWSIG